MKRMASTALAAVLAAGIMWASPAVAEPVGTLKAGKAASVVLKGLSVKVENRQGYDRDLFRHWIDADRDGCSTRNEVLIQESKRRVTVASGCRVTQGRWVSAFDRATTRDPSSLDIDHLVPLAEAWDSGARQWNAATREAFANDLGYAGSLIAVSASSNRSKSDQDPAEWLPPNAAFRCAYVTTWIAVKYRWSLSVDRIERRALQRAVKSCGNPRIALPVKATISTGGSGGGSGSGNGPGSDSGRLDPRFPTCTAAKAAGYGPYYRGSDPEYFWYRDADSDGIVCE